MQFFFSSGKSPKANSIKQSYFPFFPNLCSQMVASCSIPGHFPSAQFLSKLCFCICAICPIPCNLVPPPLSHSDQARLKQNIISVSAFRLCARTRFWAHALALDARVVIARCCCRHRRCRHRRPLTSVAFCALRRRRLLLSDSVSRCTYSFFTHSPVTQIPNWKRKVGRTRKLDYAVFGALSRVLTCC